MSKNCRYVLGKTFIRKLIQETVRPRFSCVSSVKHIIIHLQEVVLDSLKILTLLNEGRHMLLIEQIFEQFFISI